MAGYRNFQVSRNKNKNNKNIFSQQRNFNKYGENLTKSEKIMNGIATWAGFYRANPHRFILDFIGYRLKIFQMIILNLMFINNYFMYIAARSQGKTTLVAIFCIAKAILFPGTKIIVASGNLGQSIEVLMKIEEIRLDSPNLAREISELKTSSNGAKCVFHNGSYIRVVASNDGARSKRAHVVIVDEFRMVDENIITSVLRKFKGSPRKPKYLEKKEYEHLQERNQEIYLSSAWYKHHWSYKKMLAFYEAMKEEKKYFVCGLPYQISIKEKLLQKEQVLDEMSEADFNEINWMIEMGALWFGESDKAFFKFDDINRNRQLNKPIYPRYIYDFIKDKEFKYENKKDGEIRLLSCDIAVKGGKDNDASAFTLMRLIPTSNGYERQVSYIETHDGMTLQEQSKRIKFLFYDMECDYTIIDGKTIGIPLFDLLATTTFDEVNNREYPAWTAIDNEEFEKRCIYPNAEKNMFIITGNQKLNSDIAISVKDRFQRNKIKLLVSELDAKEVLNNIKGYSGSDNEVKAKILSPYLNSTFIINEMINLEAEINQSTGLITLKEPRSGRKDRYSSMSYANHIANKLEMELLSDEFSGVEDDDDLVYF